MKTLINYINEGISSKEDKFIDSILDCIPDNINKFDEKCGEEIKQVCSKSDCCTDIKNIDLEYKEDNKPICSIIFYQESKYDAPAIIFSVNIPYDNLSAHANYPLTISTANEEYDPYDDRYVVGKVDCPCVNIKMYNKNYFKLTDGGYGDEYVISEEVMRKLLHRLGEEHKSIRLFLPNIKGTKTIKEWWNKK